MCVHIGSRAEIKTRRTPPQPPTIAPPFTAINFASSRAHLSPVYSLVEPSTIRRVSRYVFIVIITHGVNIARTHTLLVCVCIYYIYIG